MPSVEKLKGTIGVLVNVIRSIYLKRALTQADADPTLNFWRILQGNLLDIAVIDWCKLFGSDHKEHQQVHWKNVVPDKDAFRKGLLKHVGFTHQAWQEYWKNMKKYRDYHAAHLDFQRRRDVTHYPTLDHAISSSCFYYGIVIEELRRLGIVDYPDDLRAYGESFHSQGVRIAQLAVGATATFPESVD